MTDAGGPSESTSGPGHKVGMVGLGIMGSGICNQLLKHGHDVVAYDLSEEATRVAREAGATIAASPAEVAAVSEWICLSLPDSPQVEGVATGPGGLLEAVTSGTTIIDFSTVAPATARKMASTFVKHGVEWLDAPVSGGPDGARNGTLTIIVGGNEPAFGRARVVLDSVGTHLEYMGPSGAGALTKLVNQLACGIEMMAMFEAFTLGTAAGIDKNRLWEVLMHSASRCWIMEDIMPATMLTGRFDQPRFALRLLHKDIRLAVEAAVEAKSPIVAGTLANQMYALAEARGWGNEDQMAVVKLYGEQTGFEW